MLWRFLPHGRTLSESSWRNRHRVILVLLWAHVFFVPLYGLYQGVTAVHVLLESAAIAAAAGLASWPRLNRRLRAGAATLGLLSSSAVLVHLSGGLIEMHFHFFVMVPVIALYQDWFPFLAAIGYVLVHHGLIGAIDPGSVYNHLPALRNPWKWAAVHAFFIAGISSVCLATWRLNENAMRQQREAEDELRDTLSLLAATLESTADGILVVNGEGRIVSYNERFAQMWSIPAGVLASRDDDRALGYVLDQLADPEAFIRKVRELYGDDEAESLDELDFKDGRSLERYSKPQRIGGVTVGRVWSFRDVTERKRTEVTLRQALHRDQEAVERLQLLDEAKNRLLSAFSHELRTPLSSIMGFAHLLRDRDDQTSRPQRREMLDRLVRNADKLQRLLLDLFDLDRLSRGIVEPRRQPTDLVELVHRVMEGVEFPEHDIRLELSAAAAAVDPGMIERVVENLLANAAKHTPPGTTVVVRLWREGSSVQLAVDDEGPGLSDELKARAFEPFQQGPAPAHAPGTGIGLALVSQFVQLHGGRAWVEDRQGGGASFRVLLPAAVIATAPTLKAASSG